MTAFEGAAVWCVAQAALLAGLGLAAARLLGRRSPAAAATAGVAAATAIVAATLLIPTPMPSWPRTATTLAPSNSATAAPDAARLDSGGKADGSLGESSFGGRWLDVRSIVSRIMALAPADDAAVSGRRLSPRRVIVGVSTVAAAVGLLRLAVAAAFVVRLRRGRTAIADEALRQQFAELCERLRVRRPAELGESAVLSSPALVGWRRPIVLLPACRDGWSDEQLRATLAHELAHAARGDVLWRAVAQLAAALHWCQPLVHWLARRVALAQELAADRMAAAAMDDRAAYLRALSELSLRLDDSLRSRAAPLVLPTFSSGLARRIAMLRSKDGSAAEGRRSRLGPLAAAAIALVGLTTTALRGATDEAPAAPVAASATEWTYPGSWPVDPETLGDNQGLVLIKPAKLARHEAFVPVFAEANPWCRELLAEAFPSTASAEIRLEAIEYIAGEVRISAKPRTGDSEDEKGKLMFSCEDFAIRFAADVDWQAWINEHVDGAETVEANGLTFVRLPAFPAFGPARLLVAERDPYTLVFSSNVDRLRAMTTRNGERSSYFSRLLNDLELMPADALVEIHTEPSSEVGKALAESAESSHDPWANALQTLLLNAQSVFIAFNLNPETGGSLVSGLIACPDGDAAKTVETTLEAGRAAARSYFEQFSSGTIETKYEHADMVQVVGTDDTLEQVVRYYRELVENCKFRVDELRNGMGTVYAETQAPFPKSIMTKYVPATVVGSAGGAEDEATTRR